MFTEEKEYDQLGALGIDLGIENIVVDSDKEILENKQVESLGDNLTEFHLLFVQRHMVTVGRT